MTDARHGWRNYAKDSSVVALSGKIHKVLKCTDITKSDDSKSQRHEKLLTQQIYHYLEEQNHSWHAIKKVKVAMKRVSAGPKYLKEESWNVELQDKVESVATHFRWAVRNCGENPKELMDVLLNIVEHIRTITRNVILIHDVNVIQITNLR
ncbi:Hypothetical predicted protein [Mytilus galloprovincialis]|uniref:Uncharacterized protein n=1 Tax=Mytilus galloprovincialis TaxID=29158 RepID=A0A8B6BK00_MYTGA|nr:Hypothetical predicted protein [Mytilus galloprovincialis]